MQSNSVDWKVKNILLLRYVVHQWSHLQARFLEKERFWIPKFHCHKLILQMIELWTLNFLGRGEDEYFQAIESFFISRVKWWTLDLLNVLSSFKFFMNFWGIPPLGMEKKWLTAQIFWQILQRSRNFVPWSNEINAFISTLWWHAQISNFLGQETFCRIYYVLNTLKLITQPQQSNKTN